MIVVDSSGWIEHYGGGPLAGAFEPYLLKEREIVTPVQVLYEVYRWARRYGGDRVAMELVGHLTYTRFVPADVTVGIVAVDMSADHGLAAADAIIYATARLEHCELLTTDTDFRGLPGVTLIEAE